MIEILLFSGKILLLTSIFVAIILAIRVKVSASTAWTPIRSITSLQLVSDMKLGWNLGNTLDANPGETSWGNPKTTHEMIDKIKAAGFNTVRIPVTWASHMGASPNYTLDQTWLNRVEEVANYALDNNMYVIINLHHENEWIKPYYANQTQTINKITKLWAQIADRFKWYSDYLVFETMNEPRPVGTSNEWTGGSYENRDVVNKYNLAAVNTIRGAGGNNVSRHIMIPTIAASTTSVAVNDLIIPNNDPRIIVSLHMYSPYSFAMDEGGTSSWGSVSDKSSLDAKFDAIYNKFVKNGIAVVIGEMGSINKNNATARAAHAEYYIRAAKAKGITSIWWDNGKSTAGAESSYSIFNRNTLTWSSPEILQALLRGLVAVVVNPPISGSVLYNFDSGLDGWIGSNLSGGPWSTTSWKYNGSRSLQGNVKLSKSAQYSLKRSSLSQNLSGKSQLKAVVRNATWGNQGTGMLAKLYIKTGSSYKWIDGGSVKINSSTGGTILTLNLSGISTINDVREIGVQFIAAYNSSGTSSIYVDYVTIQ